MPDITLTHPTAGAGGTPLPLSLPNDLLWADQYGWKSLEMAKEYTSTGALVVESWAKQAGQPMTLQGTQERAWCARGVLATLRDWAAQPGLVLSLSHAGTVYQVAFDHEQQAIDAEPLADLLQGGQSRYTVRNAAGQVLSDVDLDYFDPQPTDPFAVTLRFVIL
jgi:hypothetical protein